MLLILEDRPGGQNSLSYLAFLQILPALMSNPLNRGFATTTLLLALAAAAPLAAVAAAPAASPLRMDTNITEADVLKAQQGWCDALLAIGAAYRSGGQAQARAKAQAVLDQAYAYRYGPVAFKPTLAGGQQTFRATKEGALAYFVGGDPAYPNDKGFALKPWRTCQARNQVIQLHGMFATTMGNVDFTDSSGAVTTVDKSWTFIKEPDDSIRIMLHHSSLPYILKTP